MGAKIEFKCESCGYEVMVSGRDDVGLKSYTTTILCEDCEDLYDVITSEPIRTERGPGRSEKRPGCPRSSGHTIRRWEHPDSCPRCGNEMAVGDKISMWD